MKLRYIVLISRCIFLLILFQESDENGINKLGCFGMCIINITVKF